MKTRLIFVFSLLLLVVQSFFAQELTKQDIPANVQKNFDKKFKDNQNNIKWVKNDKNNLVASFVYEDADVSAEFEPTGKWVQTMSVIEMRDLPVNVAKYLKTNYPKNKPSKITHIQKSKGIQFNTVLPYIIKDSTYKIELSFNEAGELLESKIPPAVEKAEADANGGSKEKYKDPSDDDLDEFKDTDSDQVIDPRELPTKITSYITKTYEGEQIKIKGAILTKVDGRSVYQVTVQQLGSRIVSELYFSTNGEKLDK